MAAPLNNPLAPPAVAATTAARPSHPLPVSTEKEGLIHSLSLRVLRLSKPTFGISSPLGTDKGDLPGALKFSPASYNLNVVDDGTSTQKRALLSSGLVNIAESHTPSIPGMESFGLSEFLALPANFGDIYVGETFVCYISASNDGEHPVSNLIFKAEIQTSKGRYPLIDNAREPLQELTPGRSFDHVVRHHLSEVGGHVLVCSVGYTTHSHEQLHLRKFFKFQVTNPLTIEANIRPIPNGYLVSAEMSNQTSTAMFIDKLEFTPDPAFSVKEISTESKISVPLSNPDLTSLPIIRPNGARQSLFQLQYEPLENPDFAASVLGSLRLQWRTQLGASGVHTTDALKYTPRTSKPVHLLITKVPQTIVLKKAFKVELQIINNTEDAILPRISMAKQQKTATTGIAVIGAAGKSLKSIPPMGRASVEMGLLPLEAGLQVLTGIRVQDGYSEQTYEFNNLMTLLVERE